MSSGLERTLRRLTSTSSTSSPHQPKKPSSSFSAAAPAEFASLRPTPEANGPKEEEEEGGEEEGGNEGRINTRLLPTSRLDLEHNEDRTRRRTRHVRRRERRRSRNGAKLDHKGKHMRERLGSLLGRVGFLLGKRGPLCSCMHDRSMSFRPSPANRTWRAFPPRRSSSSSWTCFPRAWCPCCL